MYKKPKKGRPKGSKNKLKEVPVLLRRATKGEVTAAERRKRRGEGALARGKVLKPQRGEKRPTWTETQRLQGVTLYDNLFAHTPNQGWSACASQLSKMPGFARVTAANVRSWVKARDKLAKQVPNEYGLIHTENGRPPTLSIEHMKELGVFVRQICNVKGYKVTAASLRPVALAWIIDKLGSDVIKPGKGNFIAGRMWLNRLARRAGLRWVMPYGDARKAPANADSLIHDLVLKLTLLASELQIPKALILNSDQSGLHFMQTRGNTWAAVSTVDTEEHGAGHRPKRAETKTQGLNDKRQGTGTVTTAMSGTTLPGQLIFDSSATSPMTGEGSLPKLPGNAYAAWMGAKAGENIGFEVVHAHRTALSTGALTRKWLGHMVQTSNHWSNIPTSYAILDRIFVPYLLKTKQELGLPADHPSILLVDMWYGWCKQDKDKKYTRFPEYVKTHYPWLKLLFVPAACTDMVQPADRGMISWLKARMRHYYSEHFMKFVLAGLREGKTAEQIKIDVTAPNMKTLLAVTFAKALSELPAEKVRKCWFGLQKAFPSDNTDHEALLQEAKANRARLFEGGAGGGAPEPTEDEAEPDPDPGPEADMDEPDDAEPTAAEYDEFFNSILAM